jgi:hypothetical protein
MSAIESLKSPVLLEHLLSEINKLSEQQNVAMRQAALIGMTEEDAKEYNQRAAQLRELVEQLTMMYPRSVLSEGDHHGQENKETTRHG